MPTKKKAAPRGRPRYVASDLVDWLRHGARGVAIDVYMREAQLSPARGRLSRAISYVATKRKMSEAAVKQAAQRFRSLRLTAANLAALLREDELVRRARGIPDDVIRFMGELPSTFVLKYLKRAGIDGTCPAVLIAAARADDMNALLDLMSPKGP